MSFFGYNPKDYPESSVADKKKERVQRKSIERAKEQAEKKAYDKAKHEAEKRARNKVKNRFSYAEIMISDGPGYVVRHWVVESPETDEDVKRMVQTIEGMRLRLSKDTGINPSRAVPITEWKLTPQEMEQFKNRGQFIPNLSSGLCVKVYGYWYT